MLKTLLIPPLLLSFLNPSAHSIAKRSTSSSSRLQQPSPTDFTYDRWGRVNWRVDGLPFNATRSNIPAGFEDAWKRVQPVRYSWEKKKKNKKTDADKGMEAVNLIRDYTYRYVNKCVSGTMWILDYELPTDPNKYPTKFFFGTNAHVAEWMVLDDTNPYQQVLPTQSTYAECINTPSWIFRETDLNYGGHNHFRPSTWKDNERGLIKRVTRHNNVENWLAQGTHEPPFLFFRTTDVKLVYVATDFAGNGKSRKWGWCSHKTDDYLADFAVVEIDFEKEEIARKMTRDFHTKYHYKTGTQKDKAIDFFEKPLLARKTNQQMYDESIDIFLAGHPVNGLKGRSVGNYDLSKQQAGKLTYVSDWHMIKDSNYDEIIGHSNVCHLSDVTKRYGGVDRSHRGVELLIRHDFMESGSSGSLTTDGERNALGLKSRKNRRVTAIDTFRSTEIKFRGSTIIPEYDLIEGVASNPNDRSYMDSVVKYMLPQNRKTHLSEMRKWGTTDSEALKPSDQRQTAKEIISSSQPVVKRRTKR